MKPTKDQFILDAIATRPDLVRSILDRMIGYPREGCWTWPGAGTYGMVWIPGQPKGTMCVVHRVIWLANHGPIPSGLVVDHDGPRGCRNTRCANPAHLCLSTHAENVSNPHSQRTRPRKAWVAPERKRDILAEAGRWLGLTQREYRRIYGQSIITAELVLAGPPGDPERVSETVSRSNRRKERSHA
ncbi:HNH endonuclease [Propionicimonas paludicola]|uniref:HNH endonuclease n=1 Tax=Propionicimonas paludicola TaxID=185243 RepID=A0A2A9CS12_9ACTN|nr:HNH endonuclease signature motif containing protein [Propionicimonas paludicola]PFG17213.1 HNH endonuclease [Propionicimonas paludicola]